MIPSPGSRPEAVPVAGEEREAVFLAERARLVGLAYRIIGSRVEAEDVVQEAWLRAQHTDWSAIERPRAWLTTVVSRLALDHLKSASHRRETYVGPWLPEPVRTDVPASRTMADPADEVELAESLTFGFLRVLDTLAPAERVVFLLADVFDTPFRDIAAIVDRSPEACRQMASRARKRVREGRVRRVPDADADRVARELLVAVGQGDVDRVVGLLAEDVELVSDGGPDTYGARRPVQGPDRVARFMINLARRFEDVLEIEVATINGRPGVVGRIDGELALALSGDVAGGRVHAIYAVNNPAKLAALELTTPME